jgi:hypothetical protein
MKVPVEESKEPAYTEYLSTLKNLFAKAVAGGVRTGVDYGKLKCIAEELIVAGIGANRPSTPPTKRFLCVKKRKISPNQNLKSQLTFTSTKPAKRKRKDERRKPDFDEFANISQDLGIDHSLFIFELKFDDRIAHAICC